MAEHESSKNALHIWLHVQSALLGVIFFSALILNSLLIFVLHKKKSRRSNRDCASYNIERSYMYLLFHLAFADMLGVLLNITFDVFRNADIQFYFNGAGCKILPPCQLASTTAQAGTYVALSYHRFRAIVHPIRARLTVCKSLIMIAVIWVISVCLSIPFVVVQKFNETDNECFEDWNPESGVYYTFAIFVVQYAAPVILMAVFYVTIARTLHEHRLQKEQIQVPTQDDVRSHRHIVKMLVTIVTVYSVCMLPHHLYWIVTGFHVVDRTVGKYVASVSYLFTYSNSVANPLVFFFYNKESRYHLKRFFKTLCCVQSLDVPFEIKKWSATWSGHSRSDSQRARERRTSKDHLKLDQMFLARPGDSDLGVSLPWEAQVMHSHGSSEEYYHSSPPLPELSLSPGNPLTSPTDTASPLMSYSVPQGLKRYPSETTLDLTHENEEYSIGDDACVVEGNLHEIDGESGQLTSDNEDEVSPIVDTEGKEVGLSVDKEEGVLENNEEGVSETEGEGVHDETPWDEEVYENGAETASVHEEEGVSEGSPSDEGEPETAWNTREDDTARVQYMIERMMQDIRQELKQDGGMNSMKRLDDILNLNESTSNGDWEMMMNGEGLVKDMTGFLGQNPEQGTEKDMHVFRERLRSLPETRM